MTSIVCPKCDRSLPDARRFEAHMESEHAEPRAALGYGRTLQ